MRKRVNHIRLVEPSPTLDEVGNVPSQGMLFQLPSKHLLVFLDVSSITDRMFLSVVTAGMVRVFDLRVAPRFDIGQLTRSRVFELFNKHRIDYFDIPGSLSVLSRYDVRLNPESIAPLILAKISDAEMIGPNLFLLENDERAREFATLLPRSLPAPSKHIWEILVPNQNPVAQACFEGAYGNLKKGRLKGLDKVHD